MHIKEFFTPERTRLSFEIFPPNQRMSLKAVMASAARMAAYDPDFMSVTFKADGSGGDQTIQISNAVSEVMGIPSIAHLTCSGIPKAELDAVYDELVENNVNNILVLGGDSQRELGEDAYFKYAKDMVGYFRERGDFTIGCACFPEGNDSALSMEEELRHLKEKVDMGVDFLTTQMFFDNDVFYRFLDKARAMGIDVPILAGIMPITSAAQVRRIKDLSDAALPDSLLRMVYRFKDNPDAMFDAGLTYCENQMADLVAAGVSGIHVYTMNKPAVPERIVRDLGRLFHA